MSEQVPSDKGQSEQVQSEHEHKYLRWSITYRVEHIVLLASFIILAFTGLIQKFALYSLSQSFVALLGGIEAVRIIHRTAAIILVTESVWHIGESFYRLYVLRHKASMLPTLYDVRAGVQGLLYNLHLRKTRPQQGRFTFEEKLEYWALVWGTIVMAITGFVLWNPIATTRFLPGDFIPAAKAAHGGEALLAVLSIIVWHMYHVHIRHFNKSMFTGVMGEKEMAEEHPLELADIKAGLAERPLDPKGVASRQRLFVPIFGAIAIVLLIGIYQFATFEETATAFAPPPEQVVVYSPLTPTPFPTAPPTATSEPLPTTGPDSGPGTWEGGVAKLFKTRCSTCHGNALQTSDLNLESYASALVGGKAGPGIVPGDPAASQVLIKQTAGGHPGQFSEAELALIEQWIAAGALEK